MASLQNSSTWDHLQSYTYQHAWNSLNTSPIILACILRNQPYIITPIQIRQHLIRRIGCPKKSYTYELLDFVTRSYYNGEEVKIHRL